MSIKSQKKNMQAIFSLVSMDLGYIHGERESGPNGAKKEFLTKSASFLRTLGKDLGLKEYKVDTNKGGIAVSGEVTLMGMWDESNGVYFQINQPLQPFNAFLYRNITGMKDYSGGNNQWMPCFIFEECDYNGLTRKLSALRKPAETGVEKYAA
jgi:hypothetical protein